MLEIKNYSLEDKILANVEALQEVGRIFYDKNWSLGTSSNFSVVVEKDPLTLLLTASGKDKGKLTEADFVIVDDKLGIIRSVRGGFGACQKPSAEGLLHVALAKQPDVGAVLHTHSVAATVISHLCLAKGFVEIEGFEMLKGLEGITTHDCKVTVPVFENTQDIRALALEVEKQFATLGHGFLIHRHGLYTWGKNLDEAKRHIEIFEFLFEVLLKHGQG